MKNDLKIPFGRIGINDMLECIIGSTHPHLIGDAVNIYLTGAGEYESEVSNKLIDRSFEGEAANARGLEFHGAWQKADNLLWKAFRTGELAALFENEDSKEMSLPHYYWDVPGAGEATAVERQLGETAPLFTDLSAFNEWLVSAGINSVKIEVAATPSPKGRGRKPGDGSYLDEPFLEKMEKLLASGKSKSPNDAARQIVELHENDIKGSTAEQKQDRLARKYREKK